MDVGVRDLKNNLSRYIRRVERGERIGVTAHDRIVAELVPPGAHACGERHGRFHELVASGLIRTPVATDATAVQWPDIRLRRGTVAALVDEDRGEA